jgi:hypothetical protein
MLCVHTSDIRALNDTVEFLLILLTNSVVPQPAGLSPYLQGATIGPYPEPTVSTLPPPPPANLPKICSVEAPDIPRAKSHIYFPVLGSCQRIHPFPRRL